MPGTRTGAPFIAIACAAAIWPLATACAQVPQQGQAPVAVFRTIPSNPWYADPVTFDASATSDADGNIVHFAWDFGDGQNAVGVVVNHRYKQEGNYTVRLTVTDNDGLATTLVLQVTVADTSR